MQMIESAKVIPLVRLLLMNNKYADAIARDMQEIVDAHTIDAVPVVRCKDCGYRGNPLECPMCFEELIDLPDDNWDYNIFDMAKDDGFCHHGERKEN